MPVVWAFWGLTFLIMFIAWRQSPKEQKIFLPLLFGTMFVSPLIFFTNLTRNPYYAQAVILHSVLCLLFILWAIRAFRKKEILLYPTVPDLPLWIFAGLSMILWGWGFVKHPQHSPAVFSEGLRTAVFLWVNMLLAYYAAVYLIRSPQALRMAVFITILVMFLAAVYGLLQYFQIEVIWKKVIDNFGRRYISTFGNPNFISSFLVLSIPLALASFLEESKPERKLFYFISVLCGVAGLFLTLTRSSWLGLFAALFVVGWFVRDRLGVQRRWIFTGCAILLVATFLIRFQEPVTVASYGGTKIVFKSRSLLGVLWERGASLLSIEKAASSAQQRFLIWSSAWEMLKDSPFIGQGFGTFEMLYPFEQGHFVSEPKYQGLRTHANNAHNEFLEHLTMTGILGLGIFLWLFLLLVLWASRLIRQREGYARSLTAAILGGTVGMFVDNMLNVSLHFIMPGFFFWFHLGLVHGMGSERIPQRKIMLGPGVKTLLAICSILAAGVILMENSFLKAEIHYFNGFNLVRMQNPNMLKAIGECEKAHRFHPLEVNNSYELGNTYARMRDIEPDRRDYWEEKALWAYERALDANPGYDEIYFNMATVLAQSYQRGPSQEKIMRALEKFKWANHINPLSPEIYLGWGGFLASLGKGDEALRVYAQGTQAAPKHKDLWNNLGVLYSQRGECEKAFSCYQKALEADPNFTMALQNLVGLLKTCGQKLPANARKTAEVYQLSFEGAKAIHEKNWSKALELYRRILAINPKDFQALFYTGNLYMQIQKPREALLYYERALAQNDAHVPLLDNLGYAYFQAGELAKAKGIFQKALALNPQDPTAQELLKRLGL